MTTKQIRTLKLSFESRLDLFWIGWKHTRKFPDYSLWKQLKELFFPTKLEYLFG